ncbi:DUF3422 family protein [Rhizobacter sp. Root404]|uniref:DUF3422 family protein n=1 Tax=Rhizobacter sp. Root404 TaxID=1736528 RepID=UPI0006FA39D4|nr:DUF3422 domain-containing protein [Rhizobacter sp. Root404]KQW40336.1 hypothetical protein ASC76_02535 [Rhizobacter sp. Root404]
MRLLPRDHPDRLSLADEVHARPPEPLETPSRATYVAVLVGPDDRERERAHLTALCAAFGVAGPPEGATHFSASLGPLRAKWERHGEFSGYTFFTAGRSPEPFSEPPTTQLPPGWLAAIPGATVVGAHAKLVPAEDTLPDAALLARHFGQNIVVGSGVGDGKGVAYTDFRIHGDGCSRFLVLDRGFTPRQAGRMLQRLFEIEAYRMMALLALPIARQQSPRIVAIERSLAALTDRIANGDTRDAAGHQAGDDEALLQQLTKLAAEVESGLATSQFRFGACRAYFELVTRRIAELRETRIDGVQPIEEFMARRFTPAVATCATVSQRLHDLSERVAQASALLSTRVEIARERQNQSLLSSMDRRARLQLRLQQTVEGLSVAAIVYYVAGLAGYGAKALKAAGVRIDPDLAVGLAIPVVAVLVMLTVRRARHGAGVHHPLD